MTLLIKFSNGDLNHRINTRGNREQHRTIGKYPGWKGNKKALRKGVIVKNKFNEFYYRY